MVMKRWEHSLQQCTVTRFQSKCAFFAQIFGVVQPQILPFIENKYFPPVPNVRILSTYQRNLGLKRYQCTSMWLSQHFLSTFIGTIQQRKRKKNTTESPRCIINELRHC